MEPSKYQKNSFPFSHIFRATKQSKTIQFFPEKKTQFVFTRDLAAVVGAGLLLRFAGLEDGAGLREQREMAEAILNFCKPDDEVDYLVIMGRQGYQDFAEVFEPIWVVW
ncbi:hypothetical protein ACFX2J_042236 [Malus domestica]